MIIKICTIIILLFLTFSCGDNKVNNNNKTPVPVFTGTTLKGVKLTGMVASDKMKEAIDNGITEANRIVECNNYNPITYESVSVEIKPSVVWKGFDRYTIPTHPVYKGTIYDHDGVMHIAGEYNPETNSLIMPNSPEALDTEEVIRYEVEHLVLRNQDPTKYEATKVHNADNIHPILTCP